MEDTAQPVTAAETDPMAAAAEAFKVALGQSEPRKREPNGQFAPSIADGGTGAKIEATEEAQEADAGAESQEVDQVTDEAADEAQPEDVALPTSWPAEHAETWQTLPAEAKAVIADREAQRDAAVNAKFQEAANVRRANEALIAEAQANREKFIQAADEVQALVRLDRPTPEQFGAGTGQYNREAYDLAVSQYEQATQIVEQVRAQREQAFAQQNEELETAERQAFESVEGQFRPKLLELIPDLASPEKQGAVIQEIARYAIDNGIPERVFTDPKLAGRVTSPELTMAWKAMQFDKQQAAKGRVVPKAAKAPAPTVRPGAQPTRSSIQNQQYQKDTQRLAKSGSVEDGAAVWKRFL